MPTLADLPTLPTVTISGVHLCETGNWNGIDYSRQDLAAAAANWVELKGQWDVPLRLGHPNRDDANAGTGDPATGWIDNVRLEGDSLIGDYVKVPR